MTAKKYYSGIAFVVLSSLGFGLIPVFALNAYETGISVPVMLFCRFSVAALIFILIHLGQKKPLRVTGGEVLNLFVLGYVCYAAQAYFYFSAIRFIQPSFAVLLLYVFPIIVALLSRWIDKEKFTWMNIASITVSGLGLLMILGAAHGAIHAKGVVFAFSSAVVYATYVYFGHRSLARIEPLTLVTYSTMFSALGFLTIGALTGSLSFDFHPLAWVYILCLALFSTVMGIGMLFKGTQILGPTRASIISAMEPVFAILFSMIFFHDRLSPLQWIGAVLVIGSVILLAVFHRRESEDFYY